MPKLNCFSLSDDLKLKDKHFRSTNLRQAGDEPNDDDGSHGGGFCGVPRTHTHVYTEKTLNDIKNNFFSSNFLFDFLSKKAQESQVSSSFS